MGLKVKLPKVYLFIAYQFLFVVFLAAILSIFLNKSLLCSLLAGGLLGVFSNFLFAVCFFSIGAPRAAKTTLYRFYTAELIKLVSVFVIFAIVIKHSHLAFLPFLASYLVIYLNFSFMGLFFL